MTHSSTTCRSCESAGLERFLSLGRTPLANALRTEAQLDQPEPTFPLDVAFCPNCALVQIEETVPPEELFSEYIYFSSFSDTMLAHVKQLAHRMIQERGLDGESFVVEAASNDGYLLQYYLKQGIPVLGIEPAANIARVAATQRGIPTLCEFFGDESGARLRDEGKPADVFHGHNVLAHVPELNGFVQGVRNVLKDDGVSVIEAPYVKDMLDRVEFDTIYHEHLCYFSLTALDRLFRRHDLLIDHVERVPIHGGTLRFFSVPQLPGRQPDQTVVDLLAEEQSWGVDDAATYRGFSNRVAELKETLCGMLADLKSKGHRIAAYGASAKGSTLLNHFGIDEAVLDFVVDRSTVKQGRYMPGVNLPIRSPEALLEEMPEYTLMLAWNFAEEILKQQHKYRNRGGRFILPVPKPSIAN